MGSNAKYMLITILVVVFGLQGGASGFAPKSARPLAHNNQEKQPQGRLKERALEALAKAVRLVEPDRHPAIKAEMLSSLAIVCVKLNENGKAEELLARSRQLIEEEDDLSKDCYECPTKEFFRILIAIDHALSGQAERAAVMLEQVVRITKEDSGTGSGQMLAGLASVFAGTGNRERALQLLNEAFELSKARENKTDKAIDLAEIVKRYVAVGELERATRIAALIEKGPFKDHALIAIAKKYGELGEFDRALKINSEVETTNFKPDVLTFLAKRYLKQGQTEKAAVLVRRAVSVSARMTASNLQQFARHDSAILLAEAGKFDEALSLLTASDAQSPRFRLLTQLAPIFARAGRMEIAEKLLSEAYELTGFSKGQYFQARDICELAQAYAGLGHKVRARELLIEAEAVLNGLEDRTNNDAILSDIAESYASLGDDEKGLQTIERIGDASRIKVLALLAIASKFAEAEQLMKKKDKIVEEVMRP